MIIPYDELSPDALQALVEDFVTRDGTDYGAEDISTKEKASRLLALLKSGDMLITYDEQTQSCGLIPRHEQR